MTIMMKHEEGKLANVDDDDDDDDVDTKPSNRRRSSVFEAHEIFQQYHRDHHHHQHHDNNELEDTGSKKIISSSFQESQPFPMFHRVHKTGVIYATSRAVRRGFNPNNEAEWANMGQGAPETGPIPNAPLRDFHMTISDAELEYAPVTGLFELREKVAKYYNFLYRQEKESQYTAANVCIVPGGRAGITRIMAILGNTQIGYFTPDYTAYEQALGLFIRVSPSPLLHRNMNEAYMKPSEFAFQVCGRGCGAVLMSNPANPTGQSIEGSDLQQYVTIARESDTAIIMDEFYSHYYYDGKDDFDINDDVNDLKHWPKTVSSAAYIDDVNCDPILIVNGLTKNWRCPGFRICWIVAPKFIIQLLNSSGSYLDGGANAPLQRLALPLMDLSFIRQDTIALQHHFRQKRDYLLEKLKELHITVTLIPTCTFYVWADLSNLAPPLNDCLVFLEECTKYQCIIVPGVFFDINPRGIRNNIQKSTCIHHVRFSYGPPMNNIILGMKQIAKMIQYWTNHTESSEAYVNQELEGASTTKLPTTIEDYEDNDE